MADNGELVIPQFKDKVIWFTNGNNEYSYNVNCSYKGILRLSPNDSGTLQEKDSLISYGEDVILDSYYQDSIIDDLDKQFLRVSTSDGFFVNWRLDKSNVEFSKLYVIGPSFHGILRIFIKDNENYAIVLDGINHLPAKLNSESGGQIEGITPETDIEADIPKSITDSDKTPVDDIFLLMAQPTSYYGKTVRKFDYKTIRNKVKRIILNELSSRETMATGTICYTPVNLEQYKALIKKGHCPNKFYIQNEYNKDTTTPADPIIRDYLICDGSLYYNEDFPELAKILNKEYIYYWREDPNDTWEEKDEEGKVIKSGNYYVKKLHRNDYTATYNNKKKVFRVPDLRRMFIKSAWLLGKDGIDNNAHTGNENEKPNADEVSGNLATGTGSYTPDSRPIKSEKQVDKHRHFITTAHYQKYPLMNTQYDGALNREAMKLSNSRWSNLVRGNLFASMFKSFTQLAGPFISGSGLGDLLAGVTGDLAGGASSLLIRRQWQWMLTRKYYGRVYGYKSAQYTTDQELANPTFGAAAKQDKETGKWELCIDNPGVLAPKNNMSEFAYIYEYNHYNVPRYEGWAVYAGMPYSPAGYFLSVPRSWKPRSYDVLQDADTVLSSEEMISIIEKPTSADDIEYGQGVDGDRYHDEYVDVFENGTIDETYGMENTPEYVALLPLIKI